MAGEGSEAAEAEVAAAAHEREPCVEVDAKAVEDRGEVGGDGAELVAAHDAAGSVRYSSSVTAAVEAQPSGWSMVALQCRLCRCESTWRSGGRCVMQRPNQSSRPLRAASSAAMRSKAFGRSQAIIAASNTRKHAKMIYTAESAPLKSSCVSTQQVAEKIRKKKIRPF